MDVIKPAAIYGLCVRVVWRSIVPTKPHDQPIVRPVRVEGMYGLS